ncbi:PAAR domain-containing protein [Paraburkholderia rhizosphaerae]|uniref:PAAR motif-containing protein n=1 Tax=Paraburkholderia rhizosphaerae TaxID=480658 RepID=A0A4V3HF84_9BURK|nr:PAAR domain-containing protein [Paraburkholderia rhizosphaerae]TDY51811.1 PAAR motif-containing protein [Paraburkholderia rhizosphaerae]
MLRRIAVVGDTLTSGGVILPYGCEMDFMFHGRQVALIGGESYCGKCESAGVIIKAGGPTRLNYMNTREVALHGDIVLCKCEQHPLIIALHAGDSTVDDEAERYATALSSTSASRGEASDASTQSRAYDEQVAARASCAALEGYPRLLLRV